MNKKYLLIATLFSVLSLQAQDKSSRDIIISEMDQEAVSTFSKELVSKYEQRLAYAKEQALANNLPIRFKDEQGHVNVLVGWEEKSPIYYRVDNSGSAITARVNKVNTGGSLNLNLNGEGITVGVWDGGPIRKTHQDLVDRVTIKDGENFLTPDEDNDHAIHVTGTIVGSGAGNALRKGLAFNGHVFGHTFDNDVTEILTFARGGYLLSNHSYGARIQYVDEKLRGAYSNDSKTWDELMNSFPYYQPVISAGNDRSGAYDNTAGVDLLIGNKTSKNGIVVAAVNQTLSYTGPNSVSMSTFSSWGPTDDYRIKPDISAKGVGVLSLSSDSDTAEGSKQGTSMAAPAVAATLALYQQHYFNLNGSYMKAATLKTVMTNTADEAGTTDGPDHKFGWGLINAEAAAKLITARNTTSIIDELSLANGEVYETTITSTGQKLKATIGWTDPAGTVSNNIVMNDPTSKLVNDLDLRLFKNGVEYLPWVLNRDFLNGGALKADNSLDNIEQVEITVPSGNYTLRVTHKGTLTRTQNFALVVSNASRTAGVGAFEKGVMKIYPNPTTGIFNVSLDADFDGVMNVYDVQGRLVMNQKAVKFSNHTTFDMSSLNKGVYMFELSTGESKLTQKVIIK
ncbi:MAG: S8 family peptidase [Flavobacterium sp.]|nr:S8 family peptidase [Candidatus Neoflavobacterium equi]